MKLRKRERDIRTGRRKGRGRGEGTLGQGGGREEGSLLPGQCPLLRFTRSVLLRVRVKVRLGLEIWLIVLNFIFTALLAIQGLELGFTCSIFLSDFQPFPLSKILSG